MITQQTGDWRTSWNTALPRKDLGTLNKTLYTVNFVKFCDVIISLQAEISLHKDRIAALIIGEAF